MLSGELENKRVLAWFNGGLPPPPIQFFAEAALLDARQIGVRAELISPRLVWS